MAERKRTEGQTMIYKTLHSTLKIDQEEVEDNKGIIRVRTSKERQQQHKLKKKQRKKEKKGWTNMLRKCRQFLLHIWHPSCYCFYKTGNKSWMRKGPDYDYLRQTEHIRGPLWHRYSVTVNYVMMVTVKLWKWWLQLSH